MFAAHLKEAHDTPVENHCLRQYCFFNFDKINSSTLEVKQHNSGH